MRSYAYKNRIETLIFQGFQVGDRSIDFYFNAEDCNVLQVPVNHVFGRAVFG